MSTMWSGPGRALQAHLDLFELIGTAARIAEKERIYESDVRGNLTVFQHASILTSITMTAVKEDQAVVLHGESGIGHRDRPSEMLSPDNVMKVMSVLRRERAMLDSADTLYVNHHISETVRLAAESAEPEPLFPTDLPSPTGLVVLERPLLIWDLDPDTGSERPDLIIPIRMIGWATEQVNVPGRGPIPGVTLYLYTDKEAFRRYYIESFKRLYPERAAFENWDRHFSVPLWLIDMTGWAFGEPWRTGDPGQHDKVGEIVPVMSFVRRYFMSLMRFYWQRIVVPEHYRPNRGEVRRWHRAKFTEEPHIKVLRLRRIVEAERRGEDTTGWEQNYRVVVRGHWRRQYYPSLGPARNLDGSFNHHAHRLVWIEPHVRGQFGPLLVGHNVSAMVR